MTKQIDVQRYMKTKISNRIKQKRKGKKMSQSKVYPGDRTYLPLIENINSEKNRNKTKNMLPDGVAYTISETLEMTMDEIYFGEDKNIEKLVKYIFYKVAFNFKPQTFSSKKFKGKYMYEAHKEVTKIITQISQFYSPLSIQIFMMKYGDLTGGSISRNRVKMDKEDIQENVKADEMIHIDSREDDDTSRDLEVGDEHIYGTELKKIQMKEYLSKYRQAIDYLWNLEKDIITSSFLDNFYEEDNDSKTLYVDLNKINQQVSLWINTELKIILKEIKEIYKSDSVLSIGFKVYDLSQQRLELTQENHQSEEEREYNYFPFNKKFNNRVIGLYNGVVNELIEQQLSYLNTCSIK